MSDYFEENLTRMQKIKTPRIRCGGFIPVSSDDEAPDLDPKAQFKLVFEKEYKRCFKQSILFNYKPFILFHSRPNHFFASCCLRKIITL